MKIIALLISSAIPLSAAVITQWNFNSVTPDGLTTTGTDSPSTGSGTASLLTTTTTATFAAGSSNSGSSDPNTTDNSAWGTLTYPAAAVGDLTAGVQFVVDTTGYESVIITYDLRHSNTSSRHEGFQYTTDGLTWNTSSYFTAPLGDTWNNRSIDLSAIPLAGNNPNFGIRVVSAFERTATGSGAANYVPTNQNSTYAISGTWRFDMVTVSGTSVPEPSSALLGLVAVLGLARRRR